MRDSRLEKKQDVPASKPSFDVEEIKDFAMMMLERIVDHPDKLNVDIVASERTVILEIDSAKSDIQYIIGRAGKNIGAIQHLLNLSLPKTGKKVNIRAEVKNS